MEQQQSANSQPTLPQDDTGSATVDVRQFWQAPTLKRLRVSLDTASDPTSGSDGVGRGTF